MTARCSKSWHQGSALNVILSTSDRRSAVGAVGNMRTGNTPMSRPCHMINMRLMFISKPDTINVSASLWRFHSTFPDGRSMPVIYRCKASANDCCRPTHQDVPGGCPGPAGPPCGAPPGPPHVITPPHEPVFPYAYPAMPYPHSSATERPCGRDKYGQGAQCKPHRSIRVI